MAETSTNHYRHKRLPAAALSLKNIFAILGDGNELKTLHRDVLRKSLTSDSFGKLNIEGGMLKGNYN